MSAALDSSAEMHLKLARVHNFALFLGAALRLDSVVDNCVAISVTDQHALSLDVRSVILLGQNAQALHRRRFDKAPDAVVEAVLLVLDASVVVKLVDPWRGRDRR